MSDPHASPGETPSGTTADGPRPLGAGISVDGDWAAQLTAKVEQVVSVIRDKTVRPVETAVRYLIFGLVVGLVGLLAAVLSAVALLRILDDEVPVFRTRVWASYLVVAGIFWVAGLLLSRMRHPRS